MAEAILKDKNLAGIEVRSAGVFASYGQGASDQANYVLLENKINHEHVSTPLSEQDLDWATHIFTMTEGHKKAIMNAYPKTMDKAFTLKEFVNDDIYNRDVSDPYGGSRDAYRETFNELKGLIHHLIQKLEEQ